MHSTGLFPTQVIEFRDMFLRMSSSQTRSFWRKRYMALASESLQANRRIECTLLENRGLRIKFPYSLIACPLFRKNICSATIISKMEIKCVQKGASLAVFFIQCNQITPEVCRRQAAKDICWSLAHTALTTCLHYFH